ncbi:MAG: bifunctional histidinol-phosphatase/imidazoleglycerol-phosphate dehydratase HisB [Flavobacteriaceae bacterium]|jgi:imidazoleglycerol-phosphate dehydratase/histidinol-phosphatase|nr:bifunctional histidinol-phosphatase/imidazoleglycerol-phosphate dehydratase HisB [Flavobacteriaceae bacterium]NVJ72238.1 bifunctional histidinol-phosphatase/imidazoleglycerol-phosphate dehydratase HisB [Flavobacteriaceae bacterium]
MKKVLFIDRDGTLIIEPKDDPQIDAFEKVSFYPKAIATMAQIAKLNAFELVMVSNQDGLGTDSFPEETFWPVQNFIVDTFKSEGVEFSEIVLDRTFASDNAPTRKPGTALLTKYMDTTVYDLENSYVIGDRITDVALAKNLGCKAIYINSGNQLGIEEVTTYGDLNPTIALESTDWSKIYAFLTTGARTAQVVRTTKETDIKIDLDLNGVGKGTINTGISFFDHMLDQLSKHGQVDLSIEVKGDLEVDEHHTIEDTAIALGEAFAKALGSKLGIERYGFCLPMDDCLAQVAIDFGGRNWLEWDAEFKREMVGKMPTEMFFHFFKSFSDGAKANLNIKAEGVNEHHKIEAIFKAFAKAIKMAIKQDPDKMVLPSTKGML